VDDELSEFAAVRVGWPAELSVRVGERVPDGLPQGECIVTCLDDGSLHIDRADPRVLISRELLDSIASGDPAGIWIESADGKFIGSLLTIRGVNREVAYRITGYVSAVRGYIGEWPD
jgi:hypothetical protein